MADILVIDDEAAVRSTIRSVLEFGGHHVCEAGSGEEAFAALRKLNPDLILCDVAMPAMNGHEVLKELREHHPKFADMPFLFLSALAGRGDILEGLDLGADDYLTKPIDNKMLLAKVEAALRQVARMQEKKDREHVKLYKALSHDGEPKPVRELAGRRPKRRPGDANKNTPAAFDRRLQDIVRPGTKGSAGKVHFINLSELRQHLGDRWAKVSETATGVAETVIKRHLTKSAVYRRYSAEAFFILFPDLDQEEAAFQVESIANEICIRLLGEDDDAYRQISLTSTVKEIKELVGDGSLPTLDGMVTALDRHAAATGQQAGGAQNLAARVLEQATVKYLPIWKPDAERVVAYQACCGFPTGHRVFPSHGSWSESTDNPLAATVRMLMADKVAAYLKATIYKAGRAAVSLPIQFSALVGGDRKRIENFLDEIPLRESRDLLMIEVIVPRAGVDASAIADALGFVKDRSHVLAVRCSPRHPQAPLFAEAGARVLSMQFAPQHNEMEPSLVHKGLRGFVQAAAAIGLEPYVIGVDTLGGVKAAIQAGVGLVAGRGIGRELDRPRESYPLLKQHFMTA